MKNITLRNYDIIEIMEENGNIYALKKTRDGVQIINKLNVSREMGDCLNASIIELSNSAFYIVWMKNDKPYNKIFGRRYTPQGLAGKINEFTITNHPELKDINIELKDDFFIVLTWTSIDGNIYKKTFNQDAESKSSELFIAKSIVDEVKKNFKDSEENIKYKVVEPLVSEKIVTKVVDFQKPTQPKPTQSKPIPPQKSLKPKNMFMPLRPKIFNVNQFSNVTPPLIKRNNLLPPISKKELVFKTRKNIRGTMRMKFK